ncbi:type II restriction enzyme, methylase subunit [Methanobrevibacter ruminantium M1]|uniref:site-specific DNA-methyltransferase (adenine-specific) n=1 Tax=Methanobrevibacter ruminantium (strain ATCC 35063 / DSM 1093 / JCM 13430 / OCM 146 / M1) TaxID=634498 RepID=D3E000_METRM|nr:N-6 DNA methylase [Methanobrevibacter ruminantium]ADC46176.1 type II restriction enzyme, methylase subunit [Methanobrevibacter ruminantium M1]
MESKDRIENTIFNDKRMDAYIDKYFEEFTLSSEQEEALNIWIDKLNNDQLTSEKGNYHNFFEIILEDLLGYKRSDVKHEENIGDEGHPVEFVLEKDGKDYVIIELKGTTYKDLTKRRPGQQSPVEQATNYASAKKETEWATVSNYDEFRFFNPTARDNYISFKFRQLKDLEIFKKFLLVFSKFSLIDEDIPKKLLNETKVIERELENEFYQLYSDTRLMIIKELEYSSEDINRIEAIKLSQIILNRFIFLCFAEDLALMEEETTADVLLTPLKHRNLIGNTMWNRLNELFIFANQGNKHRRIPAFNGGLFEDDLSNLKIRDEIEDRSFFENWNLKEDFEDKYEDIAKLIGVYKDTLNPIFINLLIISTYDFDSELDVNILGHIFENSISDIEELKNDNQEQRKKDGVYYTPEYITDYICRNTIIPYLSISGKASTVHELLYEYESSNSLDVLDSKLTNIKVLDPACGSGSMLNKSVDILFEIHEALHASKYAGDSSLDRFFDSLEKRKEIISNNIYGVDLNEESVEITKLSLFLKLATTVGLKEGFQLPSLDKHIKCGDSLVDDESIAGNKAFNWYESFSEVFESGGFDIIVGNPPYVDIKEMDEKTAKYIFDNYETSFNRINLYSTFVEKSYYLLKNEGIFSFIMPNSILFNSTYSKIRELILNNTSILNIVRTSDDVFKDAKVEPIILIFKKGYDEGNKTKILIKKDDMDEIPINNYSEHFFTQERWFENNSIINIFSDDFTFDLLKKIDGNNERLIDYCDFSLGLTPYDKYKGMSEDIIKNRKFHSKIKLDDTFKELLDGSDITRYNVKWGEKEYIKYGDWLGAPREEKFFKNPRILIRQILSIAPKESRKRIFAAYTEEELYNAQIAFNLVLKEGFDDKNLLKYFLGIINSKMMTWYYEERFMDKNKKNFAKILIENAKNLPVIINSNFLDEIVSNVDSIIELNKEFYSVRNAFQTWLKIEFEIEKLSKKLENYYDLNFEEFLKEIKKKKVVIRPNQIQDLSELFNESLGKIEYLQREIKEADEKINLLVYELYGLNHEEIEIIENSFND